MRLVAAFGIGDVGSLLIKLFYSLMLNRFSLSGAKCTSGPPVAFMLLASLELAALQVLLTAGVDF